MRVSFLKSVFLWIVITALVTVLSGCWFEEQPLEIEESYTDSEGNVHYIANENHFKFDMYNILEVVVSETERFILYNYDYTEENSLSGTGEWIKDGVSIPIYFDDGSHSTLYGHDDIVIQYDISSIYYKDNMIPEDEFENKHWHIAKIHNDTEKPGLSWCTSANSYYPYNDKYGDEIDVEYKVYTRDDLSDGKYIPERAKSFYSANDKHNVSFVSNEIGLKFDAKTGKGTWALNDKSYTIIASFNQEDFTFSVRYDTKDQMNGYEIFSGKGKSIDENVVVYDLTFLPDNCYDDTLTTIEIKKQIK